MFLGETVVQKCTPMALKNQQKIDKTRDWRPIGTQVYTSGPKVIQKCSKGVPKVLKKLSKSDPKRSQLANIVFCRSWKHPVTKGAGGSGRSPLNIDISINRYIDISIY